jgi:hypothetical protein
MNTTAIDLIKTINNQKVNLFADEAVYLNRTYLGGISKSKHITY